MTREAGERASGRASGSMSSSRATGAAPLFPSEEGDVLAVPGFGFLPQWFYEQVESVSDEFGLNAINDTWHRNSAKCQIVELLFNQSVFPIASHANAESDSDPAAAAAAREAAAVMCPPLFDNASCFPATPAGHLMEIPCMEEYHGIRFNTSGKRHANSQSMDYYGKWKPTMETSLFQSVHWVPDVCSTVGPAKN